jgi:hypothetical protein
MRPLSLPPATDPLVRSFPLPSFLLLFHLFPPFFSIPALCYCLFPLAKTVISFLCFSFPLLSLFPSRLSYIKEMPEEEEKRKKRKKKKTAENFNIRREKEVKAKKKTKRKQQRKEERASKKTRRRNPPDEMI